MSIFSTVRIFHRCLPLFFAAALTACATVSKTHASRPAALAHVLRYSDDLALTGLNPHLVQSANLARLASLTMAWLLRYDHRNLPTPELATVVPTQQNGGISADGKTITWHLRHGVRWSDGAPFTASDVLFSTQVVLNPRNNEVGRDGWDLITKMEAPDPYTVVFHLKKPFTSYVPIFFTSAGANPCILPKHLLGALPDINHAAYNALPVGIGPFRYVRWKRGDSVELEANPYYWRGRPKLAKILYKIIPDRNTLLAQVQSGELDLWADLTGNFADRLRHLPNYVIIKRPSFSYDHLDFNTLHPVGRDPLVRQAMRLAIDRKFLLQKISHGYGALQESVIPKAAPAFDASIPLIPFDIARAKRMLNDAGWLPGRDGIRSKNGVRLVYNVAMGTGASDADTGMELMRGWWSQIGVGLTIRHYDNGLLFAPRASGGILLNGRFDLIAFAWQADPSGDASEQYGCAYAPPAGQNISSYCNPRVDAAFETYKTVFDPVVRRKAVQDAQRMIAADAPVVVLGSRENVFAVSRAVTGFNPGGATPFDDMMNVDVTSGEIR